MLDAQRQLAQAEQQRAQAQVQARSIWWRSDKALGGGWEPYQQVQLPDYAIFGDAADNIQRIGQETDRNATFALAGGGYNYQAPIKRHEDYLMRYQNWAIPVCLFF